MTTTTINARKGFAVRANNGTLISRHDNKADAIAVMRQRGITRCFVQYFLMRPIDYAYEAYRGYRDAGYSAADAANLVKCEARA